MPIVTPCFFYLILKALYFTEAYKKERKETKIVPLCVLRNRLHVQWFCLRNVNLCWYSWYCVKSLDEMKLYIDFGVRIKISGQWKMTSRLIYSASAEINGYRYFICRRRSCFIQKTDTGPGTILSGKRNRHRPLFLRGIDQVFYWQNAYIWKQFYRNRSCHGYLQNRYFVLMENLNIITDITARIV